ncbi:MAG: SDR family NAD(P)-dependent oxidoreductase [Kiloniellaceae bacterium]
MAEAPAPLFDLTGRVALVTGGSSGIGRRMAGALAGAGARVVLIARRRAELEAAVAEIAAAGGRAAPLQADLAAVERLAAVAAAAGEPFGTPDILVNAAGINLREAPEDVTLESWNRTLALNLAVPFFLARELVPDMRAKGWGRIINIASLQSVRALGHGMAYGASKAGVAQLTRAMAEAWSADGIACNAIAPGMFPTELTAPVFADEDLAGRFAAGTAIGRNGRLEDLDGITVFLAAPASDYVTGQVIFVDGGYTAK